MEYYFLFCRLRLWKNGRGVIVVGGKTRGEGEQWSKTRSLRMMEIGASFKKTAKKTYYEKNIFMFIYSKVKMSLELKELEQQIEVLRQFKPNLFWEKWIQPRLKQLLMSD